MAYPPTVLAILDGFGYSPKQPGNAIALAKTPNLDHLWSNHPRFLLSASQQQVGLSKNEPGNSETGHLTIGTGRVVEQSLTQINQAIASGSFFENRAFLDVINHVRSNKSTLHLYGLVSTAGIHAHLYHYLSLIHLAKDSGIQSLALHLILDGADSGGRDSPLFIKEIDAAIAKYQLGSYQSLIGRHFAMNRSQNWQLTSQAYQLLLGQAQAQFPSPQQALEHYYHKGLSDQNIPPTLIVNNKKPALNLSPNDGLIITNYREDRIRQITKTLSLPAFDAFPRPHHPTNLSLATMTSLGIALPVNIAFPPPPLNNTLSDILARHQIPQIHLAESEKFAHVTYFFNGGRESLAPLEKFVKIDSLPTENFTKTPQLKAPELTSHVLKLISEGWRFILVNFANADLLGHTGNLDAAVKGVEYLDQELGKIWQYLSPANGQLIITSDHGNCEIMIHPKTKALHKDHTTSPVPLIVCNNQQTEQSSQTKALFDQPHGNGDLTQVAPTILSLLHLPAPAEMSPPLPLTGL